VTIMVAVATLIGLVVLIGGLLLVHRSVYRHHLRATRGTCIYSHILEWGTVPLTSITISPNLINKFYQISQNRHYARRPEFAKFNLGWGSASAPTLGAQSAP